ncbi:hypothetical protein [Alistipes sp.]|uniref:hypothetical protein n=1 Tax=Alistipes sp. TaxID=1872444 RepID=UPI0025BEE69D|nr:hypothetical protein [Alistipes sp.]MCI7139808.1 hypothetical protein [Alistipes sp.]MDY5396563.1 hypothetical protein [Alistipes sp.]
MKRLLLLLCALLTAPCALQAAEYENAAVRFTIPDSFDLEPYKANGHEGFEASDNNLRLVLFTLCYTKSINQRENLKVEDAQWLVSLKDARLIETWQPIGRRYDRVSTYLKGDRSIRVYRYVAARSLNFLVAESLDGDWTQADAIARSQRYQKSLAFYMNNFTDGLIRFIMWCGVLSGICMILFNFIEKYHDGKFLLITIPVMLLCVSGVWIFGWPLSLGSLLLGIWPSALAAALAGDSDDTPTGDDDEKEDEDPNTYDGTGPTILDEI